MWRANTRFAPTGQEELGCTDGMRPWAVGANLVFALFEEVFALFEEVFALFEEVFALLGDIFALLGDVFVLPNIRRGAIRRSISRCDWATHENIFSPAR